MQLLAIDRLPVVQACKWPSKIVPLGPTFLRGVPPLKMYLLQQETTTLLTVHHWVNVLDHGHEVLRGFKDRTNRWRSVGKGQICIVFCKSSQLSLHSVLYRLCSLICSLSNGLALKVTTRLGAMVTGSPVRGLRPGRPVLERISKLPKPEIFTSCPFTS